MTETSISLEPSRPSPVLNKQDFVRRYQACEFGNAAPTWDDIEAFLLSDYEGLIHIRSRIVGSNTWYDLDCWEVSPVWDKLIGDGLSPDELYISAMAPTEKTIFQGEVQQHIRGLELTYTTIAKPMREALAECVAYTYGLSAVLLLRHYLCPKSYDWLEVLLERYPAHVVEFSTYSTQWGTLPGFNTVFWEIRRY